MFIKTDKMMTAQKAAIKRMQEMSYEDKLILSDAFCSLPDHHDCTYDLRQEYVQRITEMQATAQEQCVKEVLDNGESVDDYSFHETSWWEENVYHYKCWREKK